MSVTIPDYTAPTWTVTNAPTGEAYWAKVYAGQIAAVDWRNFSEAGWAKEIASLARELAAEMCKEGEG